jgi:hypothetical protein
MILAQLVIEQYQFTHRRILNFLSKMSDEQIHWRLSPQQHHIAFHAWHLARWADYTQAAVPGMTPELGRRLPLGRQIWHVEELRAQWGFPADGLGYAETGMSMSDELAMRLQFPVKAVLLDYVERAFIAADQAAAVIDDMQFQQPENPQPLTEGIFGGKTVGDAIMAHVTHDNRHLGMMECLLGLQGQPGTASV